MGGNRRERPCITISTDLRHGAGRACRRTFRESLLKRLSWFVESPAPSSRFVRIYVIRAKKEEQFCNIDFHEREKWGAEKEGQGGERKHDSFIKILMSEENRGKMIVVRVLINISDLPSQINYSLLIYDIWQ